MKTNLPVPLVPVFTVYITINLLNSKTYCGVHKTLYPYDNYLGSGTALWRSIEKHGKQSFKKIVIAIFDSAEQAYDLEARIVTLKVIRQKWNYNCVTGGRGGYWRVFRDPRSVGEKLSAALKGRIRSPEHCKHISEAKKGKPSWNLGIPHTQSTKDKISARAKGRVSPRKGIKCTEEHKRKVREANRGKIWMKNVALGINTTVKKDSPKYLELLELGYEPGMLPKRKAGTLLE